MNYSIIRPLCENEPLLEQTLETTFNLDGDYEIIFCAERDQLDAVKIAKRLCEKYPNRPSQIVTKNNNHLENPKLNNLCRAWPYARGEWIIIADSNVLLRSDTIDRLGRAWKPHTGMVCSPPLGICPNNFWAEVEAAFLNTFQAKWQLLADCLGQGYCQGKVMFCNKEQIDSMGGLSALKREPAEDAAATKLIRSHGLKIRLARPLFEQPLGVRSFRAVWHRQLRWAKLRRTTFPFLYALEIVTTLFPTMIFFWFFPIPTAILFLLGYVGETLLAAQMGWPVLPFGALLVRDLLLTPIWVQGWFSDKYVWASREITLT